MSFGPYLNMTEGKDVIGNEFSRINDIYSIFRQELHPPHRVLATWAGQFVVSRKRLLDNTYKSYRNLLDIFEAPEDHWIWNEGWWNSKPSDPTLGMLRLTLCGLSLTAQVTRSNAAGRSYSTVQTLPLPRHAEKVADPHVNVEISAMTSTSAMTSM